LPTTPEAYLAGLQPRARRMRLDTAAILKRFFFCEQALIIGQAGRLVDLSSLEAKTVLPRLFWEDAMTANAMRERVFELHYPSRLMVIGDDAALVELMEQSTNAPSAEAYFLAMAQVLEPALLGVYQQYIDQGDDIADGPTLRFMRIGVREKAEHIAVLNNIASELLAAAPDRRIEAEAWAGVLGDFLSRIGGISLDEAPRKVKESPLPGARPFKLPQAPLRDSRFYRCRFYWPDVIVPDYSYGEGLTLQLRSAISHINEVWAVDAAAIGLHVFSDVLGWEFVFDAARWTYDEARHCSMGYNRLKRWGFQEGEIPLGNYIAESAWGEPSIYMLGMLAYFETKNIGKKKQRAKAFGALKDNVSQHDMEFDWADEPIHAHYGSHWIGTLRQKRPDIAPDFDSLRAQCDALVARTIASATDAERTEILNVAQAMIDKARQLSRQ